MFFSKYKECHDLDVHNAVMKACIVSNYFCLSGTYCLKSGRLIISFNSKDNDIRKAPNIVEIINVLSSELPQKYSKFDLWNNDIFQNSVPEKILSNTGYVSMYHPEANII